MSEAKSPAARSSPAYPAMETRSSGPEPGWDTVASHGDVLLQILSQGERDPERLTRDLEELAEESGNEIYSHLLFLLAHLRFGPAEAALHWRSIVDLQQEMSERLRKQIDIRVALVSYFVDVSRRIRSPKVIELQLFRQTQASAYKDALTGLYNYRYFREHLEREIRRCERSGSAFSLVMADIDDFKPYNDRNGHETGNRALAEVARVLSSTLRDGDVAIRYGGEEFVLLLPAASKGLAGQVAERARRRVEDCLLPGRSDQPGGRLTVSLGVATFPGDAETGDDLVAKADKALYEAKGMGKNQVVLYGHNLRSHRRIDVSLAGDLCLPAEVVHSLTTVNISEAGMAFMTDRQLGEGALLDVKLHLPQERNPVELAGRVVRSTREAHGRYHVAMNIIDIAPSDRDRLALFLRP